MKARLKKKLKRRDIEKTDGSISEKTKAAHLKTRLKQRDLRKDWQRDLEKDWRRDLRKDLGWRLKNWLSNAT